MPQRRLASKVLPRLPLRAPPRPPLPLPLTRLLRHLRPPARHLEPARMALYVILIHTSFVSLLSCDFRFPLRLVSELHGTLNTSVPSLWELSS